MRDWVTNVRDTHYIIGTATGACVPRAWLNNSCQGFGGSPAVRRRPTKHSLAFAAAVRTRGCCRLPMSPSVARRGAGPHPFPTIVRDFQAVIGREARAQVRAVHLFGEGARAHMGQHTSGGGETRRAVEPRWLTLGRAPRILWHLTHLSSPILHPGWAADPGARGQAARRCHRLRRRRLQCDRPLLGLHPRRGRQAGAAAVVSLP
jgi:hypothetical protein